MNPVGSSHIIQNPAKAHESSRKVMDGVISSGVLSTFQENALDGIIKSGMTKKQESHSSGKGKGGKRPMTSSVKAPATKYQAGFVKYPGSSY